jgi:RNA polymerase-binding transcription factor DksA
MDEDFVERAEALARAEVQAGIERARSRMAQPPGFDGTCECGQEIHKQRILLGYYRCLDCQSHNEKRARYNQ